MSSRVVVKRTTRTESFEGVTVADVTVGTLRIVQGEKVTLINWRDWVEVVSVPDGHSEAEVSDG